MERPAEIQRELNELANPKIAEHSQRFFKTGPGEYGYGDVFLGIRVPVLRQVAKKYVQLSLAEIETLLGSTYHEERLTGLLILVKQYDQARTEGEKEAVYQFYLNHFPAINNWDLVDTSSPYIVGRHLMDRDRSVLYQWARSEHLWTRRIAMISQWWLIRNGDLSEVFSLAEILLEDSQDLIHKAVGWMLREAAKKDLIQAEAFLKQHYQSMPRTMLRYSIEKFPDAKRQRYLKGLVASGTGG